MRTFHIIKLSLAAVVILLCMPAKAQQLVGGKVSLLNKEVKKTGNNVAVNMDFKLDNLQVKSNKGTVIIPMIVNQQDTLKMPAVEIMGRKRYIYYQRNNKTATQIHLSLPDVTIRKPRPYIMLIQLHIASG